ncbi:MAG: DUF475 domain-containing protein [Bdellovibrionota bacterium]
MKSNFSYFRDSTVATFLGLIISAGIGYYYSPSVTGALNALFITAVLIVLEVSLSFDNAVVNATVLKKMTPLWRHRFLTWGMLIAVFGMRLVFPLAIVAIVAQISPWAALVMAATDPQEYAKTMMNAHLEIAAFGGSFLMLVGLKYFYDEKKESHWISFIEKPLAELGKIQAIEIGLTITLLIILTRFLPNEEQIRFILAGLLGVIVFVAVDGIGSWLEFSGKEKNDIHRASLGMFLYLEVLDSSFSFDGVIGAFAITKNLFIIMIGLSIGAYFVRSLTILFVEKNTLGHFAYLEHGAFYAIIALASMMLLGPFMHIPEWITGLCGAVIIGLSVLWSVKWAPPIKQSDKS